MASENKDTMAVDRRKIMAILVELRDEARRIGNRDARETAEDHIKQARLAKTEDDWLDLQTATHYIDEMMHSKPGKKDKMAVEDRFYFGKGRKERFGYNWWSQQQQELVPAASRASSSARTAAADLQRLATRLEAQGKFLKSVKQQDLTGTNQKLYDAVYEIISDIQKVKDLLGG